MMNTAKPLTSGSNDTLYLDHSLLNVRLKSVELYSGADGGLVEQQLTVPGALIVLLAGNGKIRRENESVQLERDHIYACNPESTFGLFSEPGQELSVITIRLDLMLEGEESRGELTDGADRIQQLFKTLDGLSLMPAGRLSSLFRSIYENFAEEDSMKRWRAGLDCSELLYELLTSGRRESKEGAKGGLERSKAYMKEHFSEDLSIERLASIADISSKYFVDLFKKTYGLSALDYVTKKRMDRAKSLMLRTDRLLKDIAHEVGYADEFYFSRKFKQTVGMSPTAYMKKRGKKIAAYGSTSITGYLLPFGIIPYAAPLHSKWSSYYCSRYGSEIPVHLDAYRQNHYKEQNLVKLELAKPDVIVCSHGLEPWERERLTAISQVLELPEDKLGWRRKLDVLAESLGEQAEKKRYVQAFDQKVMGLKEKLKQCWGTQSLRLVTLKLLKNQFYLHISPGMYDVLYQELELPKASASLKPEYNERLSLEELRGLNADLVLLLVCQESETLENWARLRQSTEWMSLPIVREDKVTLIASEPWREYSPIALDRVLDETERLLTGNRP